jgi:hypothetical protein
MNVSVVGPKVSLPRVAGPPENCQARILVLKVPAVVGVPLMMPVDSLSKPLLLALATLRPGGKFVI